MYLNAPLANISYTNHPKGFLATQWLKLSKTSGSKLGDFEVRAGEGVLHHFLI